MGTSHDSRPVDWHLTIVCGILHERYPPWRSPSADGNCFPVAYGGEHASFIQAARREGRPRCFPWWRYPSACGGSSGRDELQNGMPSKKLTTFFFDVAIEAFHKTLNCVTVKGSLDALILWALCVRLHQTWQPNRWKSEPSPSQTGWQNCKFEILRYFMRMCVSERNTWLLGHNFSPAAQASL